jgi:hypothetical protein
MGISGVGFSVTNWQRMVSVAARDPITAPSSKWSSDRSEPSSSSYSDRDREVLRILRDVFGMPDQQRTFGFVTTSPQRAVVSQEWQRVITITTSAAKEAAVLVTQRGQDLIAARFGLSSSQEAQALDVHV